MKKFLRKSKFISFFIILNLIFQTGPIVSVATAIEFIKNGTTIDTAMPASSPTDPDPGEIAARNPSCNALETDPIHMNSGEFTMTYQDLCPDESLLPVKFFRTYRSQRAFNGPLGYGWYYNFYQRLQKLSNNNILLIDGETGRKNEFIPWFSNTFFSPPGIYEELFRNTDGTYVLIKRDGTKYNFDLEGRLSSIIDRNNNTTSFTYDPAGKLPIIGRSGYFINISVGVIALDYRLTTITDSVGRSYHLNYNSDGRISTIVDYAGRTWIYSYENDDLKSVTTATTPQYPSGLTTIYTYDPNHNLETITDPKGQTFVTNHYDTSDRVAFQDLGPGTVALTYDTVNLKTTVTDVDGHVSEWKYNAAGNPLEIKYFTEGLRPDDPVSGYKTVMTYNSQMEVDQITYPKGNGTKFVYNTGGYPRARGNLLEVRQKTNMALPDSFTNDLITYFSYETQFNQIKTMTDPKGNVTTYTYDYELSPTDPRYGTKGNLVKIQRPTVNSQTPITWFRYNSRGQITEVQDPNNLITQLTYDSSTSYLKEIKQDPSGINAITLITYDAFGHIDTVTDANNHAIDLNYNELGWMIEEMNALGYKTKYTYDQNKNVTQVERQADTAGTQWQTTSLTYNIFNLIATVTDPLNRVTTYGYDNSKNRTSILDHEGNTTTFEYDERDLLFKVKNANTPQGITQYDYDVNGNIKRIKDANSVETNYTYDLFDRQQRITYADTKFSEFTYDKNNNITRHTTPSTANIDFTYDALDRPTAKQFPATPTLNSTYAYDIGSRLIDANNPASSIHFTYDALNRIDIETQTLNSVVYTLNHDFDKVGNRTKLLYPSAKNVEYVYDVNDRLQNIKVNTALMTQYTYDELDRRTQRDYMTTPIQGTSHKYTFSNELSLVISRVGSDPNIAASNYTYDGVGNRITQDTLTQNMAYSYNDIYELTQVTGSQSHTYNYDKVNNRLTADGVSYTTNNLNQYTGVGASAFSYDTNGNLTNDGVNVYTYDAQNRLTTVDAPGTTNDASYAYDAFDRRVSKTVGGVVTRFIYDGDESIAEYNSGGTLQAEYVFGEGLDEVLTMTRSGNTYYYHTDGLGSVTKITNSVGTVVDSFTYDAYGQTTDVSSINNPYMFTGARFDKESGLYYLRARMYDPKIGRFLQRDPIGNFDSENLYQYTLNNPINYVDTMGLFMVGMDDDPELDKILQQQYEDGMAALVNEVKCSDKSKPTIRPEEPSTFDQISWGLGGLGKLGAGPIEAWIRIHDTYSKFGKFYTFGISFGSNKNNLWKIPNSFARELNKKLRNLQVQINNWRFKDPGHIHWWKRKK